MWKFRFYLCNQKKVVSPKHKTHWLQLIINLTYQFRLTLLMRYNANLGGESSWLYICFQFIIFIFTRNGVSHCLIVRLYIQYMLYMLSKSCYNSGPDQVSEVCELETAPGVPSGNRVPDPLESHGCGGCPGTSLPGI